MPIENICCCKKCMIFIDPFDDEDLHARYTYTPGDWIQSGGKLECVTAGSPLTFPISTSRVAAFLTNASLNADGDYCEISNGHATFRQTAFTPPLHGGSDVLQEFAGFERRGCFDVPVFPDGLGGCSQSGGPYYPRIVSFGLMISRCVDDTCENPDCDDIYHTGQDLIHPLHAAGATGLIERVISGDYSAEPVTFTIKASAGVTIEGLSVYRTTKHATEICDGEPPNPVPCISRVARCAEHCGDGPQATTVVLTLPTFNMPQYPCQPNYSTCHTSCIDTRDGNLAALLDEGGYPLNPATYCDDAEAIWQAYFDCEAACEVNCVDRVGDTPCTDLDGAVVVLDVSPGINIGTSFYGSQPGGNPSELCHQYHGKLWLSTYNKENEQARYCDGGSVNPSYDREDTFVVFTAVQKKDGVDPHQCYFELNLFTGFGSLPTYQYLSDNYDPEEYCQDLSIVFNTVPVGGSTTLTADDVGFWPRWHNATGTTATYDWEPLTPSMVNNEGRHDIVYPTSQLEQIYCGPITRGTNREDPPVNCNRPRTEAEVTDCNEGLHQDCLDACTAAWIAAYAECDLLPPEEVDNCKAIADTNRDTCNGECPGEFDECDDPIFVRAYDIDVPALDICPGSGSAALEFTTPLGDFL